MYYCFFSSLWYSYCIFSCSLSTSFFLQYLLYIAYKQLAKMNCESWKEWVPCLFLRIYLFDHVHILLGNVNETEYMCVKWETIWATLDLSWIIFILSLSPSNFVKCYFWVDSTYSCFIFRSQVQISTEVDCRGFFSSAPPCSIVCHEYFLPHHLHFVPLFDDVWSDTDYIIE